MKMNISKLFLQNGIKKEKISLLEQGIITLEKYGFQISEDKYVRCSMQGQSAGACERANELNRAFLDSKLKGLIACSGGDYLIQILEYIDFNKIKENAKWVQGQSDITNLLYLLTTKYDIATIYSFNVKSFGDKNLPSQMIENNISILKGTLPIQQEFSKSAVGWTCITPFVPFKGRIIGGCLDSLKDLIGTKYDNTKEFINKYKNDGIVWYFDIVQMSNEDILRTMWQIKNAGWFKNCVGILIGRIENEVSYTGISLEEAVSYYLAELKIPILLNVDLGHTAPVITIVNGSIVKIDKSKKYQIKTFFN